MCTEFYNNFLSKLVLDGWTTEEILKIGFPEWWTQEAAESLDPIFYSYGACARLHIDYAWLSLGFLQYSRCQLNKIQTPGSFKRKHIAVASAIIDLLRHKGFLHTETIEFKDKFWPEAMSFFNIRFSPEGVAAPVQCDPGLLTPDQLNYLKACGGNFKPTTRPKNYNK